MHEQFLCVWRRERLHFAWTLIFVLKEFGGRFLCMGGCFHAKDFSGRRYGAVGLLPKDFLSAKGGQKRPSVSGRRNTGGCMPHPQKKT